jgi:hypothetical protein
VRRPTPPQGSRASSQYGGVVCVYAIAATLHCLNIAATSRGQLALPRPPLPWAASAPCPRALQPHLSIPCFEDWLSLAPGCRAAGPVKAGWSCAPPLAPAPVAPHPASSTSPLALSHRSAPRRAPSIAPLSALLRRCHPQFRDKNRRDIGKSRSQWTACEMERRPAHRTTCAAPAHHHPPPTAMPCAQHTTPRVIGQG